MTHRTLARVLGLAPFASLASLVALSALWSTAVRADAGAASLTSWGWWSQTNYVNGVTAPAPENPQQMHVQAGPIVCSTDPTCVPGQAQSTATGPTELSGLRFKLATPLPDGTDPTAPVANLKLSLAGTPPAPPGGTYQVVACRTANPGGWQADQGGNWTQRAVPVNGGCATGVASPDGTTFQFAIVRSQMPSADTIDITITPPPDVANQAPFQAEFATPKSADLTLYPPSSGLSSNFSIPTNPALSGLPAAPSSFGGPPPLPAAANKGGTAQLPNTSGMQRPAALVLTGPRLVLLGLLLAIFMAGLAVSMLDVQRWLTPGGEAAGVGRFVRVRTAPPAPI